MPEDACNEATHAGMAVVVIAIMAVAVAVLVREIRISSDTDEV